MLRFIVVPAWIAGAVWVAVALPSIGGGGSGSLADLVPKSAPALTAERISDRRFALPLLSRTVVVVRNPRGLSPARQVALVGLTARLTLGRVPGFRAIAVAVPLLNTLGAPPFSREHGTTAILYLYFKPATSTAQRTKIAQRLVRQEIGHRAGEFEGVTGAEPAQEAESGLIKSDLKWVELATLLLVALAIGLLFRAPGAAALTVGAVALAFVIAEHLVAELGKVSGVAVPTDVQPVLIVLVVGVVTDYSIFFLSAFRGLLVQGQDRRGAAVEVMRQIAPVVFMAGLTVAAGIVGLLAATLGYLRGFGPGLAVAVVIAMLVAVTVIPAALGLFGAKLFWPRRPQPPPESRPEAAPSRPRRIRPVELAVRHPILAAGVALALVLAGASGLLHIRLGNQLIAGLPASSPAGRAYDEARRGFAPGALAPTMVLLTGASVARRPEALAHLEALLARQPGVVLALGPRQQPLERDFGQPLARGVGRPLSRALGVFVSSNGTAARYLLFLGSDPLGARAISEVRALNARLPALVAQARLSHAHALVAGDTALSADTVDATISDLGRVTPAVLGLIFLVMALFLGAVVAPAFLVLTGLLAALASLGLTVYVMQQYFGYGEISYYVLFPVGVLLVSLGSDYNVFLAGRIWQEGRRSSLRDAIESGGARAARPIATAGIVLAASFALLAIVPLRPFREIAFAMTIGLLVDTFIVRTILVPALLALVGPRSAWPGRTFRQHRPAKTPPSPTPRPARNHE